MQKTNNVTCLRFYKGASLITAAFFLASGTLMSAVASAQEVLPVPPVPFRGEIGLSAKDSKPDFPQPVRHGKRRQWLAEEIDAWIRGLVERRDAQQERAA